MNLTVPCTSGFSAGNLKRPTGQKGTANGVQPQGRFEDRKAPLAPGRSLNDWVRLCGSGADLSGTGGRLLRVDEETMALHSTENDAWTILRDRVYCVTSYLQYHPGGVNQLMRVVGTDGTELFDKYHPWVNGENMLKNCLVGRFVGDRSKLPKPAPEPKKLSDDVALENETEHNFGEIRLKNRLTLTHDTFDFEFEFLCFEQAKIFTEVPLGGHVILKLRNSAGSDVLRPYTPVVPIDPSVWCQAEGASAPMHFAVKIYPKGQFTQLLDALKIGDLVQICKAAEIEFQLENLANVSTLYILAAGSGITPLARLVRSILHEKSVEKIKICLVFFNKHEKDIIWRMELENLRAQYANFHVIHVLSQPSDEWTGYRGSVSVDLLVKLSIDFCDSYAIICGPTGFNNACFSCLKKHRWLDSSFFTFGA